MTDLLQRVRARNRRSEAGFTLIELVVSLVLLTLLTGAIAAAIVGSFSTTRASDQRTKESNDAQIIAAFLTRDAQAAGGTDPATGISDPSLGVSTTDAAGCAVPGTLLMRFKWIDRAPTTDIPNVASYSFVSGSSQIVRTICVGTGGSPTSQTLANHVISVASPQSPFAWCDGNEGVACSNFPNTVHLRFTESNTPVNAAAPATYTLSASLRPQSNATPETNNEALAAPLLLLSNGSSGCPGGAGVGVTGTGNPTLTVYGIGTINGCPASTVGGSGQVSATGGTYVVAPATCANIAPPCTVVSGKFADPFASLISNGTLPVPSTAGCNGGSNPGGTSFSQAPNGTTTFPQPYTANGNVTFTSGTYVFCNGITVNGTLTGNNVTFYVVNGTINVNNGASLTLTKPSAGPYANYGLTYWQAQGNNTPPTSGMSNTIDLNIFGTMYTPSARIQFKNGVIHIDQVIAVGLDLPGGNTDTTIGDIPVITSLSPNTRGQGAVNQNITINGANFVNGGSLDSDFGAGITVNSTTFVSSTQLTANIDVDSNAAVGTRDVTVTNGNGRTGTKSAAFNVSTGPTLTSINPTQRGRGLTNQNIVITGTGFVNGATSSFGGDINVDSTAFNNATQLTAQIDIDGTDALGARDVVVTNPDGGRAVLSGGFSVVAPTIVSVALGNGPNPNVAGTIERNDTITIVFSSQMDESDICSTWTSDTANQNFNQNGNVVNVNDGGAGNDTITISATACTANIGTINLGSTGFVTGGSATFGTNGNGNRSVFAWNATTHTLTITLGVKAGTGTLANVPGNVTPVYTASGISDSGGAGLTNSPFTLPASVKF
jgi:type II secretory pathway pseudopilin PulG